MPQVNFTREEASERLNSSSNVIQRLLGFRRPYEDRFADLHRHLVGYSETRKFPDGTPRANIFIPYPFANMRHVRAVLADGLLGIDPPFETLPDSAKFVDAAPKMQAVMENLALYKGGLRGAIFDSLGWLATYGFTAIDVGWNWDYSVVYEWQDVPAVGTDGAVILFPGTDIPQLTRRKVLVPVPRMCPRYTPLDVFDVAFDPDGAYIVHFFDKTIAQMQRENATAKTRGYTLYNEDALYEIAQEVQSVAASPDDMNAIIRVANVWNALDGTFTCMTCDEDSSGLSHKDDRYSMRASTYSQWTRKSVKMDKKLLAAGYNPYDHCRIPILVSHYYKLPGDPIGMGVIEPSFGLNEALNKTLSMIEDKWNLGINPHYFYDRSRDFDLADFLFMNSPGRMTGVDGNPQNVMWPAPLATPTGGDYGIVELLRNMVEVAASVSDPYQRGVGSPKGNRTATGIQSVIQETGRNLSGVARAYSESILEPLLQMTSSNIQQFITDELEVQITGANPVIPKVQSEFLRVRPSELAGRFHFRVLGLAYMDNRAFTQANTRLMFQMLVQLAPEYARIREAFEELFRIHRVPSPGRFLKSEAEVQAEREKAMRQQLDMMRAGVPGAPGAPGAPGMTRSPITPRRPQPAPNPVTGPTRSFAQQAGANVSGVPLEESLG